MFELPTLTSGWHDTVRGVDTGLNPCVQRPIKLDADAAEGRDDLVYVNLGHPIVLKAQRLLRRSLWSVDSPLNRVTAVVVDAMLPDGHRLHVVLEGIARGFSAVNIRKFVVRATRMTDLVGLGSLNEQAAVAAGLDIIVSGGTQAGKPTSA